MNYKTFLLAIAATFASFALLPFAASPVGATEGTSTTDCVTIPDPTKGTNYQMMKYFDVSFSRTGTTGTAVVKRLTSKPLCNDQPMVLQSYHMGPNWNGTLDNNSFLSSLPQTMAYATHFTLGKNETTKTVTVQTPEACKGTQLDTYVGDKENLKIVNPHDGELAEFGGKIFLPTGSCETPKVDVCDSKTGNIIKVSKADESKYEAKDSEKCTKIQVCVIDSGNTAMQTITKDKFDAKTQSTNVDDCKKPETPVDTPATPTTPTDTTPTVTELPKTGPMAILGSLTGIGALSYSIYAYIVSRRIA